MSIKALCTCVVLSGAAGLSAGAAGFPIVEQGKPAVSLVKTGDKQVDADIDFFSNAVWRCTGANLPVVAAPAKDGRNVRFEIEKRGVFEEDGFELTFPDESTALIRGTSVSCRWALNRILEKCFGCVFCFPGEHGTHYPRRTDASVPRERYAGMPSMCSERHMYVEDPDWERALGGKQMAEPGMFYGHMLWRVIPPKKYRGTPLWDKLMPLRNGQRRNVGDDEHHTWQPCFVSEECVQEAITNICDYLGERPWLKVFSLSVNDMEGYCECDDCAKLNGGRDKPSRFGRYKSRSEVYYRWVKRVAEGVAVRHPHVALGLLAYCGTIDPPSFRLPPNVIPFLCTSVHQMMDADVAKERAELFAAWRDKASHVGNWGYDYGALQYVVPRLYLSCQKKFFDLKKVNPGFDAYFGEGSSFIGEGPKRYMFYRRMFHGLACDDEAELDRWYEACCGQAAAPHLKAYYQEWENFWTGEAVRKTGWYGGVRGVYFIFFNHSYLWGFDKAILERATEHLKQVAAAVAVSGDLDQRERAREIIEFHRYYAARMKVFGLGFRPFSDAATAVRFFDALPDISEASREAGVVADEILRKLGYPKGYKAFPGRERTLRVFGERAHAGVNQNLLQLLNCAVRQTADPQVKAAAGRAASDFRVMPEIRERLATLVAMESLPNLADGVKPEKSIKKWTFDFPEITENRQFFCTYKLTNKRVGRQAYWMHFAGWNPRYKLWRGHDEVMLSLAPGESKTVSFFCKTISGAKGARLSICAHGSDFGTPDDIEVSELKLCEVETSVKQVWPD